MAQLIGYRRKLIFLQNSFALAAGFSIFAANLSTPEALGAESWQALKHRGEEYSMQRKFRQSADAFEQALKLLPANLENERIDMQFAAANSLNSILEIDKAIALLRDATEPIKKLKAQNKLDPQVLVSLKTLLDSNERGYSTKVPYNQRVKYKFAMTEALNDICADVYPQANTTSRKFGYARSFVANGDYPGANRQLELLLKTTRPSDPLYDRICWAHAAVERKLSKPGLLTDMIQKERKTRSEPFVLTEVANGQLWARDYQTAKQNLNKALAILRRRPDQALTEYIYSVYADLYKDCADDHGAEIWLRKRLAMFTPKDGEKYFKYSRALAHNLRRQKRYAEADNFMPQKKRSRAGANTEWEWFLTDKEKQDVAKAEASGTNKGASTKSSRAHKHEQSR